MSFRYGFVGYLIKAKKTPDGSSSVPNLDENGDPIPASNSQNGSSGNAIEFKCDWETEGLVALKMAVAGLVVAEEVAREAVVVPVGSLS